MDVLVQSDLCDDAVAVRGTIKPQISSWFGAMSSIMVSPICTVLDPRSIFTYLKTIYLCDSKHSVSCSSPRSQLVQLSDRSIDTDTLPGRSNT